MDHKHLKTIVARVLLVTLMARICTSTAMQNPQSLPNTSKHLPQLLKLQRKSSDCLKPECHNIEMHADILQHLTSHGKNIDELFKQEKYTQHIQDELPYWLTLTCSQKSYKNAALLCMRYEKMLQNSQLTDILNHAFAKAGEYGILLEFACSLASQQRARATSQ